MRPTAPTPTAMPLIGITGHYRYASEVNRLPVFIGHEPVDVFLSPYTRSVAEAGGMPILLTREADPAGLVQRLDGLVLAGGEDVDPARYGSVATEHSTPFDPGRDAFEIGLLEAAIAKGIPVLGVCRGCQVINVARGGSLVPHLAAAEGQAHALYGYPGAHRPQTVEVAAGTRLAAILGTRLDVNSYHHQAVRDPGVGVVPTARALDGVVEGIEVEGTDVIAVQWHPEMFGTDPLFVWLVDKAVGAERGSERDEPIVEVVG